MRITRQLHSYAVEICVCVCVCRCSDDEPRHFGEGKETEERV